MQPKLLEYVVCKECNKYALQKLPWQQALRSREQWLVGLIVFFLQNNQFVTFEWQRLSWHIYFDFSEFDRNRVSYCTHHLIKVMLQFDFFVVINFVWNVSAKMEISLSNVCITRFILWVKLVCKNVYIFSAKYYLSANSPTSALIFTNAHVCFWMII